MSQTGRGAAIITGGSQGTEDIVERVRAVSAPSVAAEEQQTALRREAGVISDRLRAAHKILLPSCNASTE